MVDLRSGAVRPLKIPMQVLYYPAVTADGQYLFFVGAGEQGPLGVWRARLHRDWTVETPQVILPATGAIPRDLVIANGGKHIATPASFSLTNTAGAVGSITATAGTPQSAVVGTAFATLLQATVRDASNNPISGASVTFAAPGSGASGTFTGITTVITNASGVATAPAFTANTTAGSYAVTATASGAATPASFSLTNTTGAAASITATAGTPQSASNGSAFAIALQATVRDTFGNPVSGATVTFTPPASGAGATLSNPTAVTNASGIASVTATANLIAGSYAVVASIPGQTASFSLTNIATLNVTVQTSPPGLSIQVDSITYTSPQTFSFVSGATHTVAVTGTQSAGAGTQYVFANWSDSGSLSHVVTASNTPTTYTATFTTQYQLTTGVAPAGAGSVTPASGDSTTPAPA